jgi:hypothetical protein
VKTSSISALVILGIAGMARKAFAFDVHLLAQSGARLIEQIDRSMTESTLAVPQDFKFSRMKLLDGKIRTIEILH